jgi:hypothetical protein
MRTWQYLQKQQRRAPSGSTSADRIARDQAQVKTRDAAQSW